jgi:S1-C subfamily serine protease
VLAKLGHENHAPAELRRRAERLVGAGLGFDYQHIALPRARSGATTKRSFGARITPAYERGEVIGVRLSQLRPGSLSDEMGLRSNDLITALNGYAITSPESARAAYALAAEADAVVIEIEREGQPGVISIDWH